MPSLVIFIIFIKELVADQSCRASHTVAYRIGIVRIQAVHCDSSVYLPLGFRVDRNTVLNLVLLHFLVLTQDLPHLRLVNPG